jgi:hypothetical protein
MNLSSDSHEQTPETEPVAEKPDPRSGPKLAEKKEMSKEFCAFVEKLSQLPTFEEKIAHGLAYMRSSISQEGTPRFREFWEARKVVLPCFKENINSSIRSKLWGDYVELTVEARRLKEILEEQSAFAIEQIDLAITALETDITNFQEILNAGGAIAFPAESPTIQAKADSYNQIQRELNLLNTLASRLNGFRKEVIKTDMRMRFKTKFFKRLSEIGDHIFPKRKELIDRISQEFQKDIDQFVERHFQGDQVVGGPYFALREEIKALQGMAKILTLSSGVFNRTRLKLSECWDKIKVLEKEHKKEINAKRQVSNDNRTNIEKKIEELAARSEALPLPELDKAIEEISKEMRETELHRQDVFALRDKLSSLRNPHLAAQAEKAKAFEEVEKEKLRLKRERIDGVKEKIVDLLKGGAEMGLEALEETFNSLKEEIKHLGVTKMEQQQFDRSLRQLKDLLAEAKERSLLNLSEDDRNALGSLRAVLEEKKKRRQEIKEQIESYRRALGSSNLDFEKGMQYREQMEQERELLDRTNKGIEEIEQKIAELEG